MVSVGLKPAHCQKHRCKVMRLGNQSKRYSLQVGILITLFLFAAVRTAAGEYTGGSLKQIAFPVGGIGTGNIVVDGRGSIRHVEIFNKPDRSESPPELTFFCLWAKPEGENPVVRVLERELLPPFPNPFGRPRQQLAGLPRFEEAVFNGVYPFAHIRLEDEAVPVRVSLEVWNPFIPLDPENSSIPCALFRWHLHNPADFPVEVSIAFNMANPIPSREGNRNEIYRQDGGALSTVKKTAGKSRVLQNDRFLEKMQAGGFSGIRMVSEKTHPDSLAYAEILIGTREQTVDLQTRWYRGGWWDNAHVFWDDFSDDGRIQAVLDSEPAPRGRTDVGSVLAHVKLGPDESTTIPFYLTWYVPNRTTNSNFALGRERSLNKILQNNYANRFAGVADVTSTLLQLESGLYRKSRKFYEILTSSTLPEPVLDAMQANMATLKTHVFMQTADGNLHGFEGLGNDFGCCAGNCTHVYNYAQTMAYLFPSLARNHREIAFLHDTFGNGFQAHRCVFPLGDYWFDGPPAADGHFGNIVRVYREWKLSGDTEWLKTMWPSVRKALEFAWNGVGDVPDSLNWQKKGARHPWDADKDGMIESRQHNTYDIDFYGANPMVGFLYLAALKASAEMAETVGHWRLAMGYRDIFESGRNKMEQELWNGDYYVQKVAVADVYDIPKRLASPPDAEGRIIPKYQFGDGCLTDQLLGQFLAYASNLGELIESDRIRQTMMSVFQYNFIEDLSGFENVQRVYGANDEAGLMTCTWPGGNRPRLPFVYSDELWTGIEYQAAATMIWAGLVEEGLRVVEAVRGRYQGWNRNPWGEIESGTHYVRGMSSWALLLALSGFEYDGVAKTMAFGPGICAGDFKSFWSCGSGWGEVSIRKNHVELSVSYGQLELKQLALKGAYPLTDMRSLTKGSQTVKAKFEKNDSKLSILFDRPCVLLAGETISVYF